jgi:phosphohistidine phosphatase
VAEKRGGDWPDDRERPLTPDGVTGLGRIARGLVRHGVSFDVVLSSPLVRTRQTADILAAASDPRPTVVAVKALAPGGTHRAVVEEIAKYARHTRIGIVGHEPDLGVLAARLVGINGYIEFKKGSVCRIDVESLASTSTGSLRWFLTPKLLRALAGTRR